MSRSDTFCTYCGNSLILWQGPPLQGEVSLYEPRLLHLELRRTTASAVTTHDQQSLRSAFILNELKHQRHQHAGLSLLCLGGLCTLRRNRGSSAYRARAARAATGEPTEPSDPWAMPSPTELEACEAAETGLPLSDARTWMHLRPKNLSALRLGGLTDDWEARSWSKEYMIRRFGQLKFRLRPCVSLHQYGYAGPADRLITLKEYLTSTFASRRCVLFENDFDAERLELLDGFAIPQLLSEIHGSPILSVGRRNTGIGFHRHSAAWLAQLQGRKLWFLLPGHQAFVLTVQVLYPMLLNFDDEGDL